MTSAPPKKAPYPVADYLALTPKERSEAMALSCDTATEAPCRIPVQVGLFFDGTNNNMERDLNGRRVPLPLTPAEQRKAIDEARRNGGDTEAAKEPPPLPNKPMTPEAHCNTNIVRLFNAYPFDKQSSGYYPFYIPGVGTEFREIGERSESQEGKAFAKGGQPRIVWGLFQVLNAIHRTLYGGNDPLYFPKIAGQLAQAYDNEVGRTEQRYNQQHTVTHKEWFEPHLQKLRAALQVKTKPAIPSLTVAVFGFSRGAAEAAAFCHLFDDLLVGGKLAGIPASISFLGLFDLVASVGSSASMAKTLPLPDAFFDGHWAWANRIENDPLPGCVACARHFIAAHEQRMNFPVTQQEGNMQEVFYPGVHSDVGGGYGPGEQGKGRGKQAALLSQIPLAHMYKEAKLANVPLLPFSELKPTDQDDFLIDESLAKAWDAYTQALGGNGHVFKKHMELYYRWRAARLTTLESTASFLAASTQEQRDLHEANHMLAGDLEALRYRRDNANSALEDRNQPHYAGDDYRRINQWHIMRANSRLSLQGWEQWALPFFEQPQALPPEVETFFDDYVHDSFAGFYMAGAVTEYDKREHAAKVKQKKAENPRSLNAFDKKVDAVTAKTEAAHRKKEAGEPLSADEEALLTEAEYGTPYPVMGDEDVGDFRNGAIRTQTSTRREGGGYIIRRGFYPHRGFILRRSKNEDELMREPTAARQAPEGEAQGEFVWSDNVREDLAQARIEDAPQNAVAPTPA